MDPIEGGSANDYDYANADPVNQFDLDGREAGKYTSVAKYCGARANRGSKCFLAYLLGAHARAVSRQLFSGARADTFRHVYWHALMVIFGLPRWFGQGFGRAWENFAGNPRAARSADLHNNFMGREIGSAIRRRGGSLDSQMTYARGLIGGLVSGNNPLFKHITG